MEHIYPIIDKELEKKFDFTVNSSVHLSTDDSNKIKCEL